MTGKLLVFGAGGFVGAYVAREFCAHGYEVVGADIKKEVTEDDFSDYHQCDLLSMDSVRALVERCKPTHIINLAAITNVGLSWKQPQRTVEVNVCGALNILEAVRKLSAEIKILLVGSSEEYAPSLSALNEQAPLSANNPYGLSKVTQEQFSAMYRSQYGMRIYHVRPFNHTGPGQADSFVLPSWCRQAAEISKSGRPGVMRVGNLYVKRDFSDVRDVVRAYRLILESGNCETVYNVGSGIATALEDLLAFILSLASQPITVEVDEKLYRPADNPVILCDNALIRAHLGWQPEHKLLDTVREIYQSYL